MATKKKAWHTYPTVSVVEAIKRAKIEADKIFNGEDPKEQIKSDLLKLFVKDLTIIYLALENSRII